MSMELMVLVNKNKFDSPIQKLIFLQLADNANNNGQCWPSYQYISDKSGCGKSTVRKHIKILADNGYLSVKNRKGVKGNTSNYYTINKSKLMPKPMLSGDTPPVLPDSIGVLPDSTPPVLPDSTRTSHSLEPVKEPKESKPKKKRFVKPTAEQINEYLKENNNDNQIDADYFIDYYESKDWMVGKTRMKDWKATVRNWLRINKQSGAKNGNNRNKKETPAERKTRRFRELREAEGYS